MQSGPKKALFGLTLSQIDDVVRELDLPKYIAKQIADWLYKKDITDIDQMTNLSKKVRDKLSESFEMGLSLPVNVQESKDGTKKYLYPALNGKFIETAYIPDRERHTLCVSSQVGCKMGCLFCMTAKQGFQGSLSAGA
ncbi:MAG: 23S rRNA (adenine(2503)-C(2))-methyltransferase RlmN, partial [Bacteroidales bacterium]|nr:23S rRNA (adenine(2503)-C(2))-methyltransferase RlmN [Bacteroidales bacterium]